MTDKAFVKGLNLITALAQSDQPRGITSLAEELGMTKSNVHRLLNTLHSYGFVTQVEAKGSYKLTTKLWELGSNVVTRFDFVQIAREHMPDLAEKVGETVHLSTLDGYEVIYLDKIESRHAVRSYTRIGSRAPAWCVATGKAMLAWQPAAAIAGLEPHLTAFTPASLTTLAEVEAEFATIREQGYAVNKGEWRADVSGLAAPIRGATGDVIAAIGISGPMVRMKPRQMKDFAPEVVNVARTISLALGHRDFG
ncbi:IclR family transcriptional regulator [Acidimangrovimonas sediminis]|uniref:IclR family transcriptional regulator n=1 Tax=Acidimangrovimonas sediminis TaxID=2056283 RepID=UPI000C7FBEAA|nr:IclR family transcriptional regulator [Acidimangrovimonas sediminis]